MQLPALPSGMGVSIRRRAVVGIALGLLVLTAGCVGGAQLAGGGGDGGQQASGSQDVEAAAEEPETGDGAGDGPAQFRGRAIIQTGQVELQVEDFDATQRNLTTTVEQYGGFVSDSRVEVSRVDNATYKTGRLVVRVPRENFSTLMTRAQAMGEVQSVSTDSEDVTDELVDIGARLENLRAERDRLRGLYRNASDTEDVLAVEERLSDVQGEIERLEARQQSLKRQVALSTIRVELREPRPEPGPIDADRWFDTPVLVAFLDSVNGVITSLRALVVASAYGLPYAAVYGPLVVGAVYGVRRWRRGRGDGSPSEAGFAGTDASTGSAAEDDEAGEDTEETGDEEGRTDTADERAETDEEEQ